MTRQTDALALIVGVSVSSIMMATMFWSFEAEAQAPEPGTVNVLNAYYGGSDGVHGLYPPDLEDVRRQCNGRLSCAYL